MKSIKTLLTPGALGLLLSLLLLAGCATKSATYPQLPAEVSMNEDAGRGNWLIVMLRLESGEKMPFIVDTGWPITVFDTSLEPKLGKRLGTSTIWNFGVEHQTHFYAAPKFYLGNTLLMMTGTNVGTYDCRRISSLKGRPTLGFLGMDVLEHYCLQLDFERGKIRFLNDERGNKRDWGKPFPLTGMGDGCFFIGENLAGARGSGSVVDTGCNGDGWLTPEFFQQWTNHAMLPTNGEARFPNGVLGGETYHELDLRGLGKELNENDSHIKFNGIGLHVLSMNLVTLDFPKRTLYLKRNSDWPLMNKKIETEAKSTAMSAEKLLKRLKVKGQLPEDRYVLPCK